MAAQNGAGIGGGDGQDGGDIRSPAVWLSLRAVKTVQALVAQRGDGGTFENEGR
jgi:hypothetical protein